jgi:DNA-directed RNA polymerase I and III subunit RPAC2
MVLARDPNVEFVGYSIPHPSETKMNLRLQTTGADTNEVINEGLRNLEIVSRIIRKKFSKALFSK